MEVPQHAPKSIGQIMSNCWRADPDSRPSFAQLEQMLGELLEPYIRRFYVDLNEPYLKRNEARSNTTNSGYLLMPDRSSRHHNNTEMATPTSPVPHLDYANLRLLIIIEFKKIYYKKNKMIESRTMKMEAMVHPAAIANPAEQHPIT